MAKLGANGETLKLLTNQLPVNGELGKVASALGKMEQNWITKYVAMG